MVRVTILPACSAPALDRWAVGAMEPVLVYEAPSEVCATLLLSHAPKGWCFLLGVGLVDQMGRVHPLVLLKNVVPPHRLRSINEGTVDNRTVRTILSSCILYNPGIGPAMERVLSMDLRPADVPPALKAWARNRSASST